MDRVSQLEHFESPPQSLWDRILAQPDRAPEHIALAAADRFGAAAEEWARLAGVGKTPQELARMAVRRHVHLARLEGAALGAGGVITAAPDLFALLWIQSRMVFYVAAALGYDPKHPMRPAELLALLNLYPTPAEARQALDGMGKRLAQAAAERTLRPSDRTGLHLLLARYLAKRLARHYTGRLVPLIGSPIAAVQNAGAANRLGRRALAYYGGDQARP